MYSADEFANRLFQLGTYISLSKRKMANNIFKVNSKGENKISERQFQILAAIQYLHVNTIKDLSLMAHLSESTISILISKLVNRGYLKKVYPLNHEDKRKIFFFLTDKGVELLNIYNNALLSALVNFIDHLSEEEKNALSEGVALLVSAKPETQNF